MAVSTIDPNGLNIGQIGGRRNLVINGAMQVAQRATSVTTGPNGTGEGYTTLDRWNNSLSHTTAATTFSQSSDAPDGFAYSLKYEVTTAQSSLSASDYWLLNYRIEGQDLQRVAKGTSSAKQLTLSFWAKATKTGTNNVELEDRDNNRFTTKQFTINTSNTWEYKTVTFDADTTGAFDNDNGLSLAIHFWISAGSNWTSGSVTSWASEVAANRAPSQVNNLDTIGNVFQITGVQLEVSPSGEPTPFEHRSYGEELSACQRYYCKSFPQTTVPNHNETDCIYLGYTRPFTSNIVAGCTAYFPVSMRTTPSVTFWTSTASANTSSGRVSYYDGSWNNTTVSLHNATNEYSLSFDFTGSASTTLTQFNFEADAEL
jgi:hypothetical protein